MAQKQPVVIGNAQFFDMIGNVSQWMEIPLHPTEFQKESMSDGFRFIRGGSWMNGLNDLRSGAGGFRVMGRATNSTGFRLVRIVRP